MPSKTVSRFMEEALTLAGQASPLVAPNPRVGAVIVRDGQVVGRGYHRFAGGPHAEVYALEEAGVEARGATLYCTMEPCHHQEKKTPPCVPRLIEAGVHRVVTAMEDPHHLVRGRGHQTLRLNEIEVTTGVGWEAAVTLNRPYLKTTEIGFPWVTLKLAQTLDGRISFRVGEGTAITGAESRKAAHALRASHGAILVGVGTIITDDPLLTIREVPPPREGALIHAPRRVVLDSRLRTPPSARLFNKAGGGPLIMTTEQAPTRLRQALESKGAEVVVLPSSQNRMVDLESAFRHLAGMGVTSVLVEGGRRVATAILAQGLVDRLILFVAPYLAGEPGTVGAFGEFRLTADSPIGLEGVSIRPSGSDWLVEGAPSTRRWRDPAERGEGATCSRG